jgi:hypothetical protein
MASLFGLALADIAFCTAGLALLIKRPQLKQHLNPVFARDDILCARYFGRIRRIVNAVPTISLFTVSDTQQIGVLLSSEGMVICYVIVHDLFACRLCSGFPVWRGENLSAITNILRSCWHKEQLLIRFHDVNASAGLRISFKVYKVPYTIQGTRS